MTSGKNVRNVAIPAELRKRLAYYALDHDTHIGPLVTKILTDFLDSIEGTRHGKHQGGNNERHSAGDRKTT